VAELTSQDAERLVESIGIPPRPAVVLMVMDEKSKDEPDMKAVADAIGRDVAVAAAMLKTVNSPLYGLRQSIQSIPQAMSLLGLTRVATLVQSLALKTCVGTQGIERFWDQSARIGLLCAWLAQRFGYNRDAAHTFGLFRDAGIPLLMRRFPDYKDTLRLADQDPRGFVAVEEERHHVSHNVVGMILARNWHLSENVRQAILRHHDPTVFHATDIDNEVKGLVALSHLAGQMESWHTRNRDDPEWPRMSEPILLWLMLGADDLDELLSDSRSLLLDAGL